MRLAARGLSVALPPGWDARITRREPLPGETTHAVLHAGNFPLPSDRGDHGSGAVDVMRAEHVLVCLLEHHPSAVGTALYSTRGVPRALTPQLFSPSSLQRTIRGQGGTQVFCHEAGRAFCLYVVLGSYDNRVALVATANLVLASLQVSGLGAP